VESREILEVSCENELLCNNARSTPEDKSQNLVERVFDIRPTRLIAAWQNGHKPCTQQFIFARNFEKFSGFRLTKTSLETSYGFDIP
jgi:hypothetical protein